jgi:hypothetical protein
VIAIILLVVSIILLVLSIILLLVLSIVIVVIFSLPDLVTAKLIGGVRVTAKMADKAHLTDRLKLPALVLAVIFDILQVGSVVHLAHVRICALAERSFRLSADFLADHVEGINRDDVEWEKIERLRALLASLMLVLVVLGEVLVDIVDFGDCAVG